MHPSANPFDLRAAMKTSKTLKINRHFLMIFLISITCLLCFIKYRIAAVNQVVPSTPHALPVTSSRAISIQPINTFDTIGKGRAAQSISICTEVSGLVQQVLFHSGQMIHAGQPILIIDSADLENERIKAKAKLKLLQLNFARYRKLYCLKIYPKAGLDQIKTDLESAQADLQSINIKINKRTIRAPFSGKLGIAMISVGQYLTLGEKIVDLVDSSKLNVEFSIPEIYTLDLRLGSQITLTPIQVPTKKIHGIITALDAKIDSATHMLRALTVIDNTQLKLPPETFIKIGVSISGPNSVIAIPQTAIVFRPDGSFVYRIKNSHAYLTKIILGPIQDDQAIVQQGLNATDQIVNDGQINLYDGALVTTAMDLAI